MMVREKTRHEAKGGRVDGISVVGRSVREIREVLEIREVRDERRKIKDFTLNG
jgi:hypothetical protein